MLERNDIRAQAWYWARRNDAGAAVEIVRISTAFGDEPEFWTVATMGSDEHQALEDFSFFEEILPISP